MGCNFVKLGAKRGGFLAKIKLTETTNNSKS